MDMVFPGSFDPITLGHLDIIERSAALADTLYVAVLNNPAKNYCFSLKDRMYMISLATRHVKNVRIEYFDGLLADYCHKKGVRVVARGIRNNLDYEYERDMAHANKQLGGLETLFMVTKVGASYISSTTVRELIHFGGDTTGFLPESVRKYIEKTKPEAKK